MKKLIAGNWKMNGDARAAEGLVIAIERAIAADSAILETCDFVVCPPFVHIPVVTNKTNAVAVGGQDCSDKTSGAFTGDIAAAMLKDLGARYVILGHSERRQYHKESDETVAAKAKTANEAGLITIICVGETEAEREAGVQESVVGGQLERSIPAGATAQNTVIAYEPVWAIGTGKTATAEDIRAMHEFIREKLDNFCLSRESGNLEDPRFRGGSSLEQARILYGGSVKPSNAAEIFAVKDVNGALIGGASLKPEDFMGIAGAG